MQEESRAPGPQMSRNAAITVSVVVLLVAGVVLIGLIRNGAFSSSGGSTAPIASISAKLAAQFPNVETVGVPFDVVLHANNTGDDLPDATLDLSGCSDHWVVDTVRVNGATVDQSNTEQYDIGAISAGLTSDVTVTFAPKDAGSHTCDMSLYQGDGAGNTTGSSLYDATVTSAINP